MQAHNGNYSQEDRIQLNAILKFGVILIVVMIFAGIVVWFLFQHFKNQTNAEQRELTPLAPKQQLVPPEPRLQVTPVQDLASIRKTENETLNSYGWVDREKGMVRIPISRAMEIVAAEEKGK